MTRTGLGAKAGHDLTIEVTCRRPLGWSEISRFSCRTTRTPTVDGDVRPTGRVE
jgi:hypothetical protein